MLQRALAGVLGSYLFSGAFGLTWCGKHYMSGQSILPPGGNFPLPSPSQEPLLALRCAPAFRPYLAEDTSSPAAILVDASVVHYEIANAKPIQLSSDHDVLDVRISLDGHILASGSVPLNATAYELSFSLEGIRPRSTPYDVSCEATYAPTSQSFSATASLSVLPDPKNSAVTKMDLRTGALWAKPATGLGGSYEPVFPVGFYTAFGGYLESNLSAIDVLKEQGFTIIHLVPTFDNLTALNLVIDKMQEVGLYLVYDMRSNYMNSTSVTEQVNSIKHRPNLLLWYTGDEPDGTSDPLNATTIAYDLIYSLDGYHPVSLLLNCQDYYWPSYAAGADIVLLDVFMIGNNNSWSNEWNTSCTPDYGDCGCDNCASIPAGDVAAVPPNSTYYGVGEVPANSGIGSYFDISDRVSSFKNRMEVMGWELTKTIWTVPQGFGNVQYWLQVPTSEEWIVQSILAINQGAVGVVSWIDPAPADIKSAASAFALSLPNITPYLFDPTSARTTFIVGGVSVATWRTGTKTLVLATNTNYADETVRWGGLGLMGTEATLVFVSGTVELVSGGFVLGPVGSGAFVIDIDILQS